LEIKYSISDDVNKILEDMKKQIRNHRIFISEKKKKKRKKKEKKKKKKRKKKEEEKSYIYKEKIRTKNKDKISNFKN